MIYHNCIFDQMNAALERHSFRNTKNLGALFISCSIIFTLKFHIFHLVSLLSLTFLSVILLTSFMPIHSVYLTIYIQYTDFDLKGRQVHVFYPCQNRWTMSWIMGEVRGRLQVKFWLVLHMGLQWMKHLTSAKCVYIWTLETGMMSSDESVECQSLLPFSVMLTIYTHDKDQIQVHIKSNAFIAYLSILWSVMSLFNTEVSNFCSSSGRIICLCLVQPNSCYC